MAVSINRVMLAGNLTRDPQVKFLSNEKCVASFGLAINNRFKGADGLVKEDTVFVDVEAWGRTGELVGQYLTKGRQCLIEGRLKLDAWDKDGVKHTKLKVVADAVHFLDSGKREAANTNEGDPTDKAISRAAKAGRQATGPADQEPVVASDDEPPF